MSYPVLRSEFSSRTNRAKKISSRYVVLYRAGMTNHCPGCGGTHWSVGRATAECVTCGTALPLHSHDEQPAQPLFHVRSSKTAFIG